MAATANNSYNTDINSVFAAYISEDYARAKYEAIGSRNYNPISNSTVGNVTTIKQSREVQANVPGFAKKVLAEWNTIEETFTWTDNGDTKTSTFSTTVQGAPITIEGNSTLTANGDGTNEVVNVSITVKVPLIGKKLAPVLEKDAESDLAKEAAFNQSFFAG